MKAKTNPRIKTKKTEVTPFRAKLFAGLEEHKRLLKTIMEECDVSQATVYRWTTRPQDIPKLSKEKIAIILHCHIEEIFPVNKKGGKK